MNNIGKNIKRLRVEKQWTQEDLAKLVGSDEKYISKLERGPRAPGPEMVKRLCDAFCITEQELRFGEPDKHGLDFRHSHILRMLFDEFSQLSETEQLEELVRVRKRRETSAPK